MRLSRRLLRARRRALRRVRGHVAGAAASIGAMVESLESRLLLATFTVTTTADSGAGSLRQAILDANAAAGADSIHFGIGTGLRTISPASELPTMTGPTVIDATTQPGYRGTPVIQLSGAAIASAATGLEVRGDSTIRGFILNGWVGNAIRLAGSGRNVVEHCHVGLSIFGTAAPNGDGIYVQSPGNRIGGSAEVQRNVVSANTRAGVALVLADGNQVYGNFIGTSIDGGLAVHGQQTGVDIVGGSNNRIGGALAGQRNIISGNLIGVDVHKSSVLDSPAAAGNVIAGNYIGTDVSGLDELFNRTGVRVWNGAQGNFIGHTDVGTGNLISGNADGVTIGRSGGMESPSGNRLFRNRIGLAADATFLGNRNWGVGILDSRDNGVGGPVSGGDSSLGNVISGNGQGTSGPASPSVLISGPLSTGNVIQRNIIGLDPTGTHVIDFPPVWPDMHGIEIAFGASRNRIGGTGAGEGNVISGNIGSGVLISGDENTVQGNMIGLNRAGNAIIPVPRFTSIGNLYGVQIQGGRNNLIGGSAAGARNVISGNRGGIRIGQSDSNRVQGNYIGTDITGAVDLGNLFDGVFITDGSDNVIGGVLSGERNVISGNGAAGVQIYKFAGSAAPTAENTILGNYIGVTAVGASVLGNDGAGVAVRGATRTVIGGVGAGARNVISGNGGPGIDLAPERPVDRPEGLATVDTAIFNNYIGLSADGTQRRGNLRSGILIDGAPGTIVGEGDSITHAATTNLISGNGVHGIEIVSSTPLSGVVIEGNGIGLDSAGHNLGNGAAGIWVEVADGSSIVVGGTTAGRGNTIRDNRYDGVAVVRGTGVTIRGNFMHLNGELGIDLGNDDVTLNDPSDPDAGPNLRQNFPEILSAARSGGTVMISGRLETAPGANYAIDFYATAAADPSGYGEGQIYLGNTTLSVPAGGAASFSVTLPAFVPLGYVVTATATGPGGNTSEFSPTHGVAFDLIPPIIIDIRPRFERLPHGFRAAFSEDVSESLRLEDVTVVDLDNKKKVALAKLDYDVKTDVATFEFEGMLADGNYRATFLASGITDVWDNRLDGDGDGKGGDDRNFDFFFLTADADGDRSVGFGDLVLVAQNYNSSGKTFLQGNLNYDAAGKVDFEDLVLLAQGYGTKLPEPPAASGAMVQPAGAKSVAQMPMAFAKRPTAKRPFGTRRVGG